MTTGQAGADCRRRGWPGSESPGVDLVFWRLTRCFRVPKTTRLLGQRGRSQTHSLPLDVAPELLLQVPRVIKELVSLRLDSIKYKSVASLLFLSKLNFSFRHPALSTPTCSSGSWLPR